MGGSGHHPPHINGLFNSNGTKQHAQSVTNPKQHNFSSTQPHPLEMMMVAGESRNANNASVSGTYDDANRAGGIKH